MTEGMIANKLAMDKELDITIILWNHTYIAYKYIRNTITRYGQRERERGERDREREMEIERKNLHA